MSVNIIMNLWNVIKCETKVQLIINNIIQIYIELEDLRRILYSWVYWMLTTK